MKKNRFKEDSVNKEIEKTRKKKIEEEINKIILSIIAKKDKEEKKQATELTLEGLLERSRERIKRFEGFVPKDSHYLFLHKKEEREEKINLRYEIKEESLSYSVNIGYKSNDKEQETEIKVNVKDEIKEELSKYSISIKEDKEEKGYVVLVKYENKDESLIASYKIPINSYNEVREEKLQDFTNAVDKPLELLPPSIMGGVLGFTYLGENYMARRSDLTGAKAYMVDVHEAIHTPDEYETRVLTAWMLTREKKRYKR